MTDNGPKYSSNEFQLFAELYSFSHVTSSPYYPRGNIEAERAVRTMKNLLKDVIDPYLVLMSYRATPLPWCNLFPAQLLMGRRIRTVVPEADGVLIPSWPNLTKFRLVDEQYINANSTGDTEHESYQSWKMTLKYSLLMGESPIVFLGE